MSIELIPKNQQQQTEADVVAWQKYFGFVRRTFSAFHPSAQNSAGNLANACRRFDVIGKY